MKELFHNWFFFKIYSIIIINVCMFSLTIKQKKYRWLKKVNARFDGQERWMTTNLMNGEEKKINNKFDDYNRQKDSLSR